MEKKEMFLYEQKRLSEVIKLINEQIIKSEENFNRQKNTIISIGEGMRGRLKDKPKISKSVKKPYNTRNF